MRAREAMVNGTASKTQKILETVGSRFQISGEFNHGEPLGTGHINDTYLVCHDGNGNVNKYVFQRINDDVFKEPVKVMENIIRVTQHQRMKKNQKGINNTERTCLHFFPTKVGTYYYLDEQGKYWRAYTFIDSARTYDVVETEEHAYTAGAAFAKFQKELVDLPGPRLHETIPDFHNTRKRFADFEQAVETDSANRVCYCKDAIAFACRREKITDVLTQYMQRGMLPERIIHNDAKLNNVLIDNSTNTGICVIDLDTVMPGSVLYDFGDLVRSSTSPVREDERDLSRVAVQLTIFKALAEGYISEASAFLTQVEYDHLVFGAKVIVFEQGIRFLTDFLNGDTYYKTKYPLHNLDRCRNQFKVVESIEEHEEQLNRIIEHITIGK